MIKVAEAREVARRKLAAQRGRWATGTLAARAGSGVDLVAGESGVDSPAALVSIGLKPPTETAMLADERAAEEWANEWSRLTPQPGVHVDWESRAWRSIGRQQVPVRLRLDDADAVAGFVGGSPAAEWRRLSARVRSLADRLGGDALGKVVRRHATALAAYDDARFEQIAQVAVWIVDHPVSGYRPRQVPVRGVDSKWLGAHRALVTDLVGAATGSPDLGLVDADPLVRLRVLDPGVWRERGAEAVGEAVGGPEMFGGHGAAVGNPGGAGATVGEPAAPGHHAPGPSDFAAPLSQLTALPLAPRIVFVLENLESLLAMPEWPGGVAVHGSGYAVRIIDRLPWVRRGRIIYWGDLDSNGFAILHGLRIHLPEVVSVLMDEQTLLAHRDLWVPEPTPHRGTFASLTDGEARALEALRREGDVRLEQERIPWEFALASLRRAADLQAARLP